VTAARGCRAVVVLGAATNEVESVLRRLGLVPFDDESRDATLWVLREVMEPVAVPAAAVEVVKRGPLLLTIAQVSEDLGVGRSMVYEMIARGELEVVHLGRAARVPAKALETMVGRLRNETAWANNGIPARRSQRAKRPA